MSTATLEHPAGATRAAHPVQPVQPAQPVQPVRPAVGTGHELPCQSADVDWFAEHGHVLERAKQACGPCPLRDACLRAALDRREPWGVWGGQIFVDGVVVPSKRGRGRPRKDERVVAVVA